MQGLHRMAATRGHLLLVALAAVTLRVVVSQSALQCPVANPRYVNAPLDTAQQQAVQWCRFAEQGANSAVTTGGVTANTFGTRFWGSINGPDSSQFSLANIPAASPLAALTLNPVGQPTSVVAGVIPPPPAPGGTSFSGFNSTCGLLPGNSLDGASGNVYYAGSAACQSGGFYGPTRCPVSLQA